MRTLGPGIALVLAACVSLPPPSTDKVRAAAFYESGIELRKKGEHDSAIRDFDEAIRLDPGSIDAYIDRGQSWRDRRNYEAALADFDEAIRLDPSHARAYVNRGYTWYRLGRYDQAIAEYDQAIHLGLRGAHYERGNAWLGKGDPERARADFSEAIRGDPRFALAYIGRGKAWKEAGDHDRSIRSGDASLRGEGHESCAFADLGVRAPLTDTTTIVVAQLTPPAPGQKQTLKLKKPSGSGTLTLSKDGKELTLHRTGGAAGTDHDVMVFDRVE